MKNYKTTYKQRSTPRKKQQGVALAIGIILLLIISVIGVNSMKSALLQEKMSGSLTSREYADAAAYSLLVTVENYLHRLYETNNGTEGDCPDACTDDDARGDQWHDFSSNRDMVDGEEYPDATNHLTPLLPFLHDMPRYVLYKVKDNIGTTGESEDGSAAGSGGSASGTQDKVSKYDFYRLAAKANDKAGHFYVLYESIFAVVEN